MTAGADFETLVQALGLPPEARVEKRVPKKLLIEQGAPTTADKRVIGHLKSLGITAIELLPLPLHSDEYHLQQNGLVHPAARKGVEWQHLAHMPQLIDLEIGGWHSPLTDRAFEP